MDRLSTPWTGTSLDLASPAAVAFGALAAPVGAAAGPTLVLVTPWGAVSLLPPQRPVVSAIAVLGPHLPVQRPAVEALQPH
jgi:hypothetical protein